MTFACLAALVTFAVTIPGCDLFDPGGPSFAGVVVDSETGVAVQGIQMSLKVSGGGFGASTVVAAVLTDADGRFWLRDSKDRANRSGLYVNDPECFGAEPCPFDTRYTGGLADYDFDDRHDVRVELRRRSN